MNRKATRSNLAKDRKNKQKNTLVPLGAPLRKTLSAFGAQRERFFFSHRDRIFTTAYAATGWTQTITPNQSIFRIDHERTLAQKERDKLVLPTATGAGTAVSCRDKG